MKILAGGPAAETESAHFKASRDSIVGQRTKHEVSVQYLIDQDTGDFKVEADNHHWSDESVLRVAKMRQDYLDRANAQDFDAAWFVDTDLILGPKTLELMLDVDAPIVFGVFWTRWQGKDKPMPQVWDHHPYSFHGVPHPNDPERTIAPTIEALRRGLEIEVIGGGACTLIRREAFDKAKYYPLLRGMPFWGEDRHFCTRAQAHDLTMVATGRVAIAHLYTPDQRTPEAITEAQRLVGIST